MNNIDKFLSERFGDHFSTNGENDVTFTIFEGGNNGGKRHNIVFCDLNIIGIDIKERQIYAMDNNTVEKLMAASPTLGEEFMNVYKLKTGESWFDKKQDTVYIRYK